mmetsp:Transcript_4077/g.7695  ORF Transcript_4077/g.7695 Transcript_4077/m.7695 type:complete len:200 (-) Transcript_4077:46-645(-)
MNPQSMRQRSINVHSLLGNFPLLFGSHILQRPHVVSPIGQFHEHYSDIPGHGQNQFPVVFRLEFFGRREGKTSHLGHSVDQAGYLFSEFDGYVREGDGGVFDGVVEEGGDEGGEIQFHVGDDVGHAERMGYVGLAGFSTLASVGRFRVVVGSLEEGDGRRGCFVGLEDGCVIAGGGRSARVGNGIRVDSSGVVLLHLGH